jgi:hypothetical protein
VPEEILSLSARWRAAIYLGLISSTFSTIVSQLSAARIGRDAAVDWMSVAAIPARDWALSSEPSAAAIAIGIAFHQWADFSWALFFFGVVGRWTARLHPVTLALIAVPWAVFTSAFEWSVLVPLFPFWQPIFTLQQPYWIGFLVHLSSASMYPLYAWLRRTPEQKRSFKGRGFLKTWIAGRSPVSVPWGLWRCSPRTIKNCPGSAAIRKPTRYSSGICLRTINRGSNSHRLPLKKP